MSALGQKQTLRLASPMSALPPKADIRPSNATQDFGREAKGVRLRSFGVGLWQKKTKQNQNSIQVEGAQGRRLTKM
jgi:hypothetical protein